jgi:ribokinase
MITQKQRSISFVGHISIDRVETVNGSRTQPGGAALYAAMAAKALNARPHLISAIGQDFPFKQHLVGLDSSNVKILKMPTTRFHIRYNRRWEAKYLQANFGAGTRINISTMPSGILKSQSLIHLLPVKPTKAARILENIKTRAPNVKISMSTWIGYIKEPRQRRLLAKLTPKVDYFLLNEYEAKELSQTDTLPFALEQIKTPMLIVTLGNLGAVMRNQNDEPQMIPALSVPTNKIIDTTGAGDTWQGAFFTSLLLTNDLMKSVTIASILSSIKCSQWGFDAIEKLSFKKPFDVISHVLALKEGWIQRRLTDF